MTALLLADKDQYLDQYLYQADIRNLAACSCFHGIVRRFLSVCRELSGVPRIWCHRDTYVHSKRL